MIDHVNLNVTSLEAARRFYDRALAPLGIEVVLEYPGSAGYGKNGKPFFFVSERGEPSAPVHVAITAPDPATVDAFHESAVAAGGRDNGEPGLRQYHPSYYGAFVLDPDGNNIEAVTHLPE